MKRKVYKLVFPTLLYRLGSVVRASFKPYKLYLTIASAALLLTIMLPVAFQVVQTSKKGAVVFQLVLYDEEGMPFIVSLLSETIIPEDLVVFAQVLAITSPDDSGVLKEVFKGEVKELTLRVEAEGVFEEVARSWVRFEEKRGPVTRDSGTALQLNIWIVNKTTGEVVQRVSYYYTYSPKAILEGEVKVYTVNIAVPKKAKREPGEVEVSLKPANGCHLIPYWKPVYKLMPENFTLAYGSHIVYRDGTYYVRTPLLTINNTFKASSPITASILFDSFERTWFYVAIGIGFEVEKKLRNNVDITGGLSGKVYLGGKSREMRVYFARILELVQPLEEAYIWIWARPIFIFYREYYVDSCTGIEYYTGYDKVDSFIQDVVKTYDPQLNEYFIEGGELRERLPSFIRDWIFNETFIKDTYIYTLHPVEETVYSTVLLGDLLRSLVDTCNADFQIPIGPSLAVVARRFVPHLLPLTVMISPSISISWGESETVYVSGGIANRGSYYEYLYIKTSKLLYRKDPPWWCLWCSPCYYNITVASYFEGR